MRFVLACNALIVCCSSVAMSTADTAVFPRVSAAITSALLGKMRDSTKSLKRTVSPATRTWPRRML